MRIACCLALAALAFSAGPAGAREPRVVLAFLPAAEDDGVLERLASGPFAVGVASPAAGGSSAAQAYLDIGQGARVSARVYDEELGPLRLLASGRLGGWTQAAARAAAAPGDIAPGLLGETARSSGARVAYAGVRGLAHAEAAAVADRTGRIATVSLGGADGFTARLERLIRRHSLVGARLPPGTDPADLARLSGRALVIVLRAPQAAEPAPLESGISRPEGGLLTSSTTRRPGMVALTDYAPTILDALGLEVPREMQGRPIRAETGGWEDARSLAERLAQIKSRRAPALRLTFGAWLLILAGLAAAGRAAAGLRLGLLAALWLPGVALVTGALDPPRTVETVALAAASLGLAALSDRLVAWPRAPAVPAAAVLAAHAADLVAGSPLIVRSLAGPNPGFGARFYGIGNELEAILAVMVLVGAGAALAGSRGRRAAVGFALACATASLFIGPARLGADVGGVITLGAGGAAAVLACLPGALTRGRVAIALAAPVVAVVLLAAIDVVSGGDAHLTRAVLDADSPGEVAEVAERRLEISWQSLRSWPTPLTVGIFAIAIAYGLWRRRQLLAPLGADRAFAAGMWGALAATLVGALANDSGPTIFSIGAALLVLAAAYTAGKPPEAGLT